MSIGERLKSIRGRESREEFSAKIGVHPQSLYRYEQGGRSVDSSLIASICTLYDISSEWLIFGTGPMRRGEAGGASLFFDPAQAEQRGLTMIPLVEAVLSAGGGSFETNGGVLDHFAFQTRWLHRKGRPEQMVLMRVAGDSMAPIINHQDLVLIDQSQTRLRPGDIYAAAIGDMIYLKTVNAAPGTLILSSYNKEYAPMEVPLEDMEDAVKIIGRAVWWCHEA